MRLKSREHFPLKSAEKFPLGSQRGLQGLKQPPLSPPLPGLEPTSSASLFCLQSGLKTPPSFQFRCNYFSFDVSTSIQATHDSHAPVLRFLKVYRVASIHLALLKEMRLIFVWWGVVNQDYFVQGRAKMMDNDFIHLCSSLKCGYFFHSFHSASPTFSILKSHQQVLLQHKQEFSL